MLGLAWLAPVLHADEKVVRYANDQYRVHLHANEFRYGFEKADGKAVADAHPESGLLLGLKTAAMSPVPTSLSAMCCVPRSLRLME